MVLPDTQPRRARRRAAATIASELELKEVGRDFGGRAALEGVSLRIAPGEVVSLLGQSGCGKTTLLRIAAGVDAPTAGEVLIDGRMVASPSTFVPPERRGVGLVFQDHALFPHLTIKRNVMFGLTALGRRAAAAEASAALARVGLERHEHNYPHELSGGEQQRVALARAIVPRPGILLLDEPFSGLDVRLRDEVRAETLTVLRETGATAIIVTHDPEEAMRMSDRIVLMRAGRIEQEGGAAEIYRRPTSLFAARFFSPLNEFEATVRDGRAETPFGAYAAPGFGEGAAVVVAARAQGTRLRPPRPDGSGGGMPGRIVSHRFLGEMEHFEVAVEGLETYLMARCPPGVAERPGDDVEVTVDPEQVMVFAAGI